MGKKVWSLETQQKGEIRGVTNDQMLELGQRYQFYCDGIPIAIKRVETQNFWKVVFHVDPEYLHHERLLIEGQIFCSATVHLKQTESVFTFTSTGGAELDVISYDIKL